MKYNNYIVILICGVLAMMSSCEKTININTPPYARKLAVNCNSEAGEPLYVVVGKSAAIKDQRYGTALVIDNAEVRLYVDDVYTETLHYDSVYGYPSLLHTEPGKKYTVKIAAPTYTDVEASVVAPAIVGISNIVRTVNARKDENGDWQDALTLTFSDPQGTADYYVIKLRGAQDSNFYNYSFCVNSPDASVETNVSDVPDANTCLGNTGIFLRDVLFNGRQKELVLYAGSGYMSPIINGTDTMYATIELLHVAEDYFKFEKSYKVADDANGNPFAEPVNVYTNITNGLGIFSIVSSDMREIR